MARFLKFLLVFLPLSACGGSEGAVTPPPGGGGGSVACALTGCEIAKMAVTGTMPLGSAAYMGRASVSRTEGAGAVITTNANLALNANFTSQTLTLQLTNVTDGASNYIGTAQGSATLSGAQFAGSYSGNLNSNNGLTPISGTFTGQFRGTGAVALDGEMMATNWGGGDAFGRFFANKQ